MSDQRSEDGIPVEPEPTTPPRRWQTWQVVVAVVAVAVLAVVIGVVVGRSTDDDEAEQQVSTETSGADTTATTPSTAAPTAADDLAPYVAAARTVDAQIKTAADLVNGAVSGDAVVIDQATQDAILAIDSEMAAAVIPAGLTPDLQLAVMRVQSDLQSRESALGGISRYVSSSSPTALTTSDPEFQDMLACLKNGSEAAAEFDGDLTELEQLALAAPPVVEPAPDSHAAGEVAILLAVIDEGNNGCASCGGSRMTELEPITWHTIAGGAPGVDDWNGDVGGIPFRATYASGRGWTVRLNAC